MASAFAGLWFLAPALGALFGQAPRDWNGRGKAYFALWLLIAPLSSISIAITMLVGGMLEIVLLLGLAQVANAFVSPKMAKLPFLSKHLPAYRPQSTFPFWKAV